MFVTFAFRYGSHLQAKYGCIFQNQLLAFQPLARQVILLVGIKSGFKGNISKVYLMGVFQFASSNIN